MDDFTSESVKSQYMNFHTFMKGRQNNIYRSDKTQDMSFTVNDFD